MEACEMALLSYLRQKRGLLSAVVVMEWSDWIPEARVVGSPHCSAIPETRKESKPDVAVR
jgi:hypothetical protein